jgi:hypothetical protein
MGFEVHEPEREELRKIATAGAGTAFFVSSGDELHKAVTDEVRSMSLEVFKARSGRPFSAAPVVPDVDRECVESHISGEERAIAARLEIDAAAAPADYVRQRLQTRYTAVRAWVTEMHSDPRKRQDPDAVRRSLAAVTSVR